MATLNGRDYDYVATQIDPDTGNITTGTTQLVAPTYTQSPDVPADFKTLSEKINGYINKLTADLGSQSQDLQNQINQNAQDIDGNAQDIADINGEIDDIKQDIGDVDKENDGSLQDQINDINAELDGDIGEFYDISVTAADQTINLNAQSDPTKSSQITLEEGDGIGLNFVEPDKIGISVTRSDADFVTYGDLKQFAAGNV